MINEQMSCKLGRQVNLYLLVLRALRRAIATEVW